MPNKARTAAHGAKKVSTLDVDKRAAVASDAEPLAPPVQGSEEAYDRFLPRALAIPKEAIKPFRADAALAYHNAMEGVENVMAREAELRKALPHEDLDALKALPDVVLGVIYAVLQAQGSPEKRRRLREELREAHALRRLLLKGFDALTEAGFFAQNEYHAIAAGKGPLDTANDCIALAAKYRSKWSAIARKTAITAAQLARASELGTRLQAELRPAQAKRSEARTGAAAQAAERRDRLWTLATQIHERLWSVGALVFGHAVDQHVPSLQSARRKSTAAKRAAAAQKAAGQAVLRAQTAAAKAQKVAAKKGGPRTAPAQRTPPASAAT